MLNFRSTILFWVSNFWNRFIFDNIFVLVVGEKEMSSSTVNIRTRDNIVHGEFSIEQVAERFQKLKTSRILNSEDSF